MLWGRRLHVPRVGYPDFLVSHDDVSIRWKDGAEMAVDDGKGDKNFETMLNDPDIGNCSTSRSRPTWLFDGP